MERKSNAALSWHTMTASERSKAERPVMAETSTDTGAMSASSRVSGGCARQHRNCPSDDMPLPFPGKAPPLERSCSTHPATVNGVP